MGEPQYENVPDQQVGAAQEDTESRGHPAFSPGVSCHSYCTQRQLLLWQF